MLLQNNDNLMPIICACGCYYLSLARIIELETSYEFNANELNTIWEDSKVSRHINYKNDIINPDKILKTLTYYTNKPSLTIAQVGEEKNGKVIYWQWVLDKWKNSPYLVEMVLTTGKYGTHFRLCDRGKKVIFDSYAFKEYESKPSGRYLYYSII